jgi:carboxylesterase
MSTEATLGHRAREIDIGAGPLGFLLIHGLGGTPVELRFVAEGLARAGHAVSVPLLEGHGNSDEALNRTSWQDWYGSVERASERLLRRCDMVIAGGLSSGAMLALHLAHERPDDVQGTVLFSPTLWPNGWAIPWSFNLFRLITQKWFANLLYLREVYPYGIKDERIRKFVLDSLQGGPDKRSLDDIFGRRGGTILEFKWLVGAVRKELGQISQPALIFHPRQDDQTDLSNTMKLQRKLAGRVHTVVLEDSYHMVTLDRQRAVVVERTVEFAHWLQRQQRDSRQRAQIARR